jgi:hypothetical protein
MKSTIYKNGIIVRTKNKRIKLHHNPITNGVQIDIVAINDVDVTATGHTCTKIDKKFLNTNTINLTQESFEDIMEAGYLYMQHVSEKSQK